MANSADQVANILARLDTTLNKKSGKGKKDWAALNEARKKAFWKPKDGKNQILVFTPAFDDSPFTLWGYHKGLQEVDYYSVPCDLFNKNESCIICDVVESLKKENFEGNMHLWSPIQQRIETYVPIIDMTNAATIAEGPKWFRASKTIMDQMINSMKNIEEGEVTFFDTSAPQRVIIQYDKNAAPATQYSVSFKDIKDVPSEDQYAEWAGMVQPVSEFIFSKSQDENKKLVDEYFTRVAEVLDATTSTSEEAAEAAPATDTAASKLAKFKK